MCVLQGVVIGTTHPSLYLTGQLPADTASLLSIAAPDNVLISSQAKAALDQSGAQVCVCVCVSVCVCVTIGLTEHTDRG